MNHEIENFKSSQISPNFEVHKNSKVLSGLYTQMLLDDFCRSYSIEFSVDKNRQCFYDISPVGDTLKSILSSQQPWKFENIMDDLLSHMTANLIQYGRFFAEIVLLTDCNNIIMGISFVPIHPIVSIVGRKNTYFISHRKQNDVKLYNIRNDRLITFDLHEIGCSRKIFTKALKKINKRDITEITNIILDKNLKFDLTKYTQSEEYQLLKNTKEIYWYGRNNHNQFMDDFYLLWRTAKFKEFKREILDYLLRKINTALLPYRNIANFSGEIITHCKESNYSQDFDRLQKGDLTISQFYTNYITLNKTVPLFIFDFVDHQCFHEYFMGKKRSFHSFRVKVALLRYIVFSFESGCDTSEPQVSYISRACSSLVRQPYHIPNRFLLKISGLETILATKKGRWDGRSFYMDEYTLIFLFS